MEMVSIIPLCLSTLQSGALVAISSFEKKWRTQNKISHVISGQVHNSLQKQNLAPHSTNSSQLIGSAISLSGCYQLQAHFLCVN